MQVLQRFFAVVNMSTEFVSRFSAGPNLQVLTVVDQELDPLLGNTRLSLLDIYKLNKAYNCPNVYENQCIGGQLFENESNGTITFEDGVCRFAPFEYVTF